MYGLFSFFVGCLGWLGETKKKRIIAFSGIVHVGFIDRFKQTPVAAGANPQTIANVSLSRAICVQRIPCLAELLTFRFGLSTGIIVMSRLHYLPRV